MTGRNIPAKALKKEKSACSHGGIYSVNPALVKVDFSSSLNPLGLPARVSELFKNGAAASVAKVYPDPECRQLKEKLSEYLHADPSLILVGNGSLEIIHWFARTFVKKQAVIPCPTFCEYELACYKNNASVSFVPLDNDMDVDAESIVKKARNSDAIFLCNPNNPTGILSSSIKKIVESIYSKTAKTKILLDECFIELTDSPDKNSMIGRVNEFGNLVILRSLTKSFAMAGLRLGYSVCNPKLARELAENKIAWNVNGLAQIAGVTALDDVDYLEKARAMIRQERSFIQEKIKKTRSFIPHRADANYFLIQLKNGDSTKTRDSLLKESGVLVRDCSTFTCMGTDYIRVAVKARGENLLLLDALEKADSK